MIAGPSGSAAPEDLISPPPSQKPVIQIADGSVEVGVGPEAHVAKVWLVRYDPRILQVAIRQGESRGSRSRTRMSSVS